MRFSAKSFVEFCNAAFAASSNAGVAPRASVPLIGLLSTMRSRDTCKKRSGEEEQMHQCDVDGDGMEESDEDEEEENDDGAGVNDSYASAKKPA